MRYRIEVNTARKGAPPIWRPLIEEGGQPCEWLNEPDAQAALRMEQRPDGEARVVPASETP